MAVVEPEDSHADQDAVAVRPCDAGAMLPVSTAGDSGLRAGHVLEKPSTLCLCGCAKLARM